MSAVMGLQPKSSALCCWLFCTVIDNYGDAGVGWRLAQALVHEEGMRVCLWLDDWAALRPLCPDLGTDNGQCVQGVQLFRWQTNRLPESLLMAPEADAVLELFACDLPPQVLAQMQLFRPLWLNLEYLSAEAWVDDVHLLPSLQGNGLAKYFYCPGFGSRTGGVLRPPSGRLCPPPCWADSIQPQALRQRLRLPETTPSDTTVVYVFAYASPVWGMWLHAWHALAEPIEVWLAPGQALDSIRTALGLPETCLRQAGDCWVWDAVTVRVVAFVSQAEFDGLLCLADVLLVRGEDSFVRAQWAAKPMLWHIYPQAELAHLPKLQAFWARVAAFANDSGSLAAHQSLSMQLNNPSQPMSQTECNAAWRRLWSGRGHWQQWQQAWTQSLAQQPGLAQKLASFIRNQLQ